jgi:aldehyde:ferredoxin oxidoreductase
MTENPVTTTLERFRPLHPWANRILRIDLNEMRIWVQESAPYVPDLLGARGFTARICWDECPEPVDPLHPSNPLMVMTGALTGSRAPYSGRTIVAAFSPQAYPVPWFTRSSIGGSFGGELRRAGYDGIVVTGASETPVRVSIRDDQVSILPAGEFWGLDIYDALEQLEAVEGQGSRSLTIGPAGERMSNLATIQTASSSAAGQGGFGAVMGAKNLKAISVRGTGRVVLAQPDTMRALTRVMARMMNEADGDRSARMKKLNQKLAEEGNGRARLYACTENCLTPCAVYYEEMPGAVFQRKYHGSMFCVAEWLTGIQDDWPQYQQEMLGWRLDRRAAFEMNVLSNRYGLNHFDIICGIVPWLLGCQREGLITEFNGQEMDWDSPAFWADFLHALAYREGDGDLYTRGGWAAAQTLGIRREWAEWLYAGWAHTGHWDGHTSGPFFPYWLVPAMQWMLDTRDPFNSGHGSLWPYWEIEDTENPGPDQSVTLDRIRAIGEHLYGSAEAVDPWGGYGGKAEMGAWHVVRPIILDCVPADDFTFPLIYHSGAEDGFWRLQVDGLGEIEGPSVEYHLFRAGTGIDWSEAEFETAAERVLALERALQVRHWGRDRTMDEMLLPFFEGLEALTSPFLGERYGLDRDRFRPVLDQFYSLLGWDPETGWPTLERLEELGLADLHGPMVDASSG